MSPALLECSGVSKTFHGKAGDVEALRDVNLRCPEGELVCFLGASGCGKSTLLQLIAGLERPSAGGIIVNGREIDAPSDALGMVFQDHGLFPWATVEDNVGFNLRARRAGRNARREAVREALDLVGLSGFAQRYPHELSGGMRQRAGLARALSTKPKLLLMDEPFGALDTHTRSRLQQELLAIWSRQRTTILFVTHDIDEALILADRIVVFRPRPGRIREVVSPDLARPRDPHSPEFLALARELEALVGPAE
jgi:NitT/TauT family transport system ATP-binding protein